LLGGDLRGALVVRRTSGIACGQKCLLGVASLVESGVAQLRGVGIAQRRVIDQVLAEVEPPQRRLE
jgi:hypothetical protein